MSRPVSVRRRLLARRCPRVSHTDDSQVKLRPRSVVLPITKTATTGGVRTRKMTSDPRRSIPGHPNEYRKVDTEPSRHGIQIHVGDFGTNNTLSLRIPMRCKDI